MLMSEAVLMLMSAGVYYRRILAIWWVRDIWLYEDTMGIDTGWEASF